MTQFENNHSNPQDLLSVVNLAIQRAIDDRNDSALFEPDIIGLGAEAFATRPAELAQAREHIRSKRTAALATQWEKTVKKEAKLRRDEAAKLKRANEGSQSVGGIGLDEDVDDTDLPDLSAKEFGLNQYLGDPSAENLKFLYHLMNREFAVVTVGDKVRIVSEDEGGRSVTFRTEESVRTLFKNIMVPNHAQKKSDQLITALDGWLMWPKRRDYQGVGFYPGSPACPPSVPKGHLNLWRGFRVEPVEGDWTLIDMHIRKCICGGNKLHAEFLYDWFASMIQRPQEKCPSCVVLRSDAEGTGKSIIVSDLLRTIFGEHAGTVSKQGELTGRFNAKLETMIALGVEEALFAGSRADANILKDLISNPIINIERKNVDTVEAPNYAHIVFTSNEDWVVPAGTHARRFFVLDVSNPHANKREYFEPLRRQMLSPEGAGAFLHAMLERKITHDMANPLKTAALDEQKQMSINPLDRWALECASKGTVTYRFGRPGDERVVTIEVGLRVDTDDLRRQIESTLTSAYQRNGLERRLGKLLNKHLGVIRKKAKDGKRWDYVFPSLADFRVAVSRHTGLPIDDYNEERPHGIDVKFEPDFVKFDPASKAATRERVRKMQRAIAGTKAVGHA